MRNGMLFVKKTIEDDEWYFCMHECVHTFVRACIHVLQMMVTQAGTVCISVGMSESEVQTCTQCQAHVPTTHKST